MTTPVLFVQGSAERAGAERMLKYLCKYLDPKKVTPTVLFLADGPFIKEVEELGVKVIRGPKAARVRQLTAWAGTISEIENAARSTGARIVHANGERMSIFAGRAARRIGASSIAWLHDAPGAGGASGRLAQWIFARSPKSAVVTCSRWLADDFNDRYAIDAVAIQNGLDLEVMERSRSSVAALRDIAEKQGWPTDSVVIGHFGRLQRWKGTDVFIRAAAKVAAGHPRARFLIVGGTLYGRDSDFLEELETLADQEGLRAKLHFAGYRTDALDLMAASHIVVHSSLEPDPFPTVILEGMTLGKAVVGTRTRGPEEAMEDGRTGVLVPPGDADALASAVSRLVQDPGLMESLGLAAREQAVRRFDARRMSAEFETLYQRLTANQALTSDVDDRQEAPR